MDEPPLVSLSQRIGWTKNTVIDNVKLVGLRDRCAQADESKRVPFVS